MKLIVNLKYKQMKRYSIIAITLIYFASHFGTLNSQPHTNLSQYKLVWEDNFEGEKINTSTNWEIVVDNSGGGNKELQYYTENNVNVGNEPVTGASCLIITAKKEDYKDRKATSGKLTTQNKMSFKYGKVEARIKFPITKDGLWPAFWMLGTDIPKVQWPRCGEIDIVEMGEDAGMAAGTQDRYFNGALHWGEDWTPDKRIKYSVHTTCDYSLQNDFHLYTMIWNKDSIKMYLDQDKYPSNLPYYEIAINITDEPKAPGKYFNKPFFIIFNLAIGGNFSRIYDVDEITAFQNGDAKMYVDFIRLYQTKGKDDVLIIQ